MAKKKVFIIDDALDYRILLSRAFKEAGYKVYLAKDGIEAYIKFFKIKPDIILADVLLPRMRGDVLVKWIKGSDLGKEIPIIIISGHKAMKDYLYQVGIEFFFEKPISTKDVLSLTKEVLEIYETKKAINVKLKKLRKKADKESESETKEFQKVCEQCYEKALPDAVRCESCGSSRLRVEEIPAKNN